MRTKRNETEKLITDIQNMERINESIKAFNNEISDLINNIDKITKDMDIEKITKCLQGENENNKQESVTKQDLEYSLTEIKVYIDQRYREYIREKEDENNSETTEIIEESRKNSLGHGYVFERNNDVYYLNKKGQVYFFNPVNKKNKEYKICTDKGKESIKCEKIYYSLINEKNENIIWIDKENKSLFRYNIPLHKLELIEDKECLDCMCIDSTVYTITKEEFIIYGIRNNHKQSIDIRKYTKDKDNYVKIDILGNGIFIIINDTFLYYDYNETKIKSGKIER